MPTINEDELMGYIMRKTADRSLFYDDVRAVIDAEMEYLKSKEIAEESEYIEVDGYAEPLKPLDNDVERAGDKVTIK